jgi:hypothetical protein
MTQEQQAKEREAKIEIIAQNLAYFEVRIFSKEILIRALTDETQCLQEFEKLEILYTRRNVLKKQLEDL